MRAMQARTTKTIALAGIPVVMVPIAFLGIYDRHDWQMWPFALCFVILAAATFAAAAYVGRLNKPRPERGP